MSCFMKKTKCELIVKIHTRKLLLEVLETCNLRFSGEDWDLLKRGLCETFLLPKARRLTKSLFWMRRNFAARVFALCPLKKDESLMVSMIDDPSFLVATIAAAASVKLESQIGVKKCLMRMSKVEGYYHYFYADILSQGSSEVFKTIAKICAKKDHLHLACLEVLALHTCPLELNFLTKDLRSKQMSVKLAALKVAARHPQTRWLDILCLDLEASAESVRQLAAGALGSYSLEKSFKALKKGLNDSCWSVKLASAKSLKKLDKLDLIDDKSLKLYVREFE